MQNKTSLVMFEEKYFTKSIKDKITNVKCRTMLKF